MTVEIRLDWRDLEDLLSIIDGQSDEWQHFVEFYVRVDSNQKVRMKSFSVRSTQALGTLFLRSDSLNVLSANATISNEELRKQFKPKKRKSCVCCRKEPPAGFTFGDPQHITPYNGK